MRGRSWFPVGVHGPRIIAPATRRKTLTAVIVNATVAGVPDSGSVRKKKPVATGNDPVTTGRETFSVVVGASGGVYFTRANTHERAP